ncbi:MAG: hypothetical protein QXN26_03660 [Thermoplasmataceae archaeon]
MTEKDDEMLVDGCFLTWVQVTEHYSREGRITERSRNFRSPQDSQKKE